MTERDRPHEGIVDDLDSVAERAAREFEPSDPAAGEEGAGLDPEGTPTRESGRGATVTLEADAEVDIGPGDEVWVDVPEAGRRGWSYDVEGDESVLDVDARAEIVSDGAHRPAPDGTQFVVRAERPGRAAVRFEPIDNGGRTPPRRLRVTVR